MANAYCLDAWNMIWDVWKQALKSLYLMLYLLSESQRCNKNAGGKWLVSCKN